MGKSKLGHYPGATIACNDRAAAQTRLRVLHNTGIHSWQLIFGLRFLSTLALHEFVEGSVIHTFASF